MRGCSGIAGSRSIAKLRLRTVNGDQIYRTPFRGHTRVRQAVCEGRSIAGCTIQIPDAYLGSSTRRYPNHSHLGFDRILCDLLPSLGVRVGFPPNYTYATGRSQRATKRIRFRIRGTTRLSARITVDRLAIWSLGRQDTSIFRWMSIAWLSCWPCSA